MNAGGGVSEIPATAFSAIGKTQSLHPQYSNHLEFIAKSIPNATQLKSMEDPP